jgi:hypothetical protein
LRSTTRSLVSTSLAYSATGHGGSLDQAIFLRALQIVAINVAQAHIGQRLKNIKVRVAHLHQIAPKLFHHLLHFFGLALGELLRVAGKGVRRISVPPGVFVI